MAVKSAAEGTIILFLFILAGLTAIVIAEINAVLHMIDPMAFPYAMSPCPAAADVADTITSGKVVPIETTVAPIKTSLPRQRTSLRLL